MLRRQVGLGRPYGLLFTARREAVVAVDRAVQARYERHLRFRPAGGAGDHGALAHGAAGALPAAVGAAVGATLGLVHQPLLNIEALLAGGEDEDAAAIATSQVL